MSSPDQGAWFGERGSGTSAEALVTVAAREQPLSEAAPGPWRPPGPRRRKRRR